jgi:hypothetical protein
MLKGMNIEYISNHDDHFLPSVNNVVRVYRWYGF